MSAVVDPRLQGPLVRPRDRGSTDRLNNRDTSLRQIFRRWNGFEKQTEMISWF